MAKIVLDHVTRCTADDVIAVNNARWRSATASSWCSSARPAAARPRPAHDRRARGGHRRRDHHRRQLVTDLAPKDRDIAMVFQNYALYPHMTVEQNLAFGLQLRRTPKAEMNDASTTSAAILGLDRAARAQAGRALRRPAAAGRDGPGDGARAAGVPDGRAAVEPGREAPRADARRARAAPRSPRHHHDLRHARSGRGDDAR